MNIRHYLPKVIAIAAIAVLAATNSCFGTVLSVPQRNQEKTQWCWDASSQMVLEFFGNSYSQTAIADWAVGGQNIPNYLYGSQDSSMHGCDEILAHFGSISSTGSGSAMSLSTLTSEIDAGRPPILRWGWNSGGGHIAVIHGTDGDTVYVRDPWPDNGPQIQSYAWVCNPYGNIGTWTHTLKLNGTGNEYYTYYQYYMSYATYYLNRYLSTGSSTDLYYAYYNYAHAGGYYYLSCGQTSQAFSWYYYYMSTANQVLANYYYAAYASTGSQYDLAYTYYYYAYVYYYYYLYAGNSSYANYYYNLYMYYAYYYYYL